MNYWRLYPNFDELVELGLVEKSELDKRTNEYAVTEARYEAFDQQYEWEFTSLFPKVIFYDGSLKDG